MLADWWFRIRWFFRDGARVRRWLGLHLEVLLLVCVVGVFVVLWGCGVVCFWVAEGEVVSVLGTLVQSLASVFAIVFSICLVAVQMCSEDLTHRLIRLYVGSWNFFVPFGLNLGALMFNLFLLSNGGCRYLVGVGVLFGFLAVLSLVPFFVYTIRLLMPGHVVDVLLDRVKEGRVLLEDFSEERLYRESLQPVEDIVSNCVRKGDYATAMDLVVKVRREMHDVLVLLNRWMIGERDVSVVQRWMVYMSSPFAKLLGNIAVSSNKVDAIEITSDVVFVILDFVNNFWEARFLPAFEIFISTIEDVYSQALCRFDQEEYRFVLAKLEMEIARTRMRFSQVVE